MSIYLRYYKSLSQTLYVPNDNLLFFSGAFLFYRIWSLIFQLTLVVFDPFSKIYFSSNFYAPGISLSLFKDKSVKTVRANFGFEPVPFCFFILTSFYFVKPCLNVL